MQYVESHRSIAIDICRWLLPLLVN
jgi:hypothetical protein